MKKIGITMIFLALTFLALTGCFQNQHTHKERVSLTISAAASLRDALMEVKNIFEKKYPSINITYNFAGSGVLQQQISQGAPVDLFFSAAQDKFEKLIHDGFISKDGGKNLVGNALVLIVPSDSMAIHSFTDLQNKNIGKISIGIPESVPAGIYAKETLESMHLWSKVKKNLVFAKDVRQVLTYVETGNVAAGVVYKTDALLSKNVKIIATASDISHRPIIYPVGMLKNTKHPKEVKLFYDFLQGKEAKDIFTKFGFTNLNEK